MDKMKTKVTKQESEWDKKRIILVTIIVIILLILGFSAKNAILGSSYNKPLVSQSITTSNPPLSIKKSAQDQIYALKQEASNINLVDVATSSPQVQKIINDLKAIKDYPNNQLKQTCINLCSKL